MRIAYVLVLSLVLLTGCAFLKDLQESGAVSGGGVRAVEVFADEAAKGGGVPGLVYALVAAAIAGAAEGGRRYVRFKRQRREEGCKKAFETLRSLADGSEENNSSQS